MGNTPSRDESSGSTSAVTSNGTDDPDPSPSARRNLQYIKNQDRTTKYGQATVIGSHHHHAHNNDGNTSGIPHEHDRATSGTLDFFSTTHCVQNAGSHGASSSISNRLNHNSLVSQSAPELSSKIIFPDEDPISASLDSSSSSSSSSPFSLLPLSPQGSPSEDSSIPASKLQAIPDSLSISLDSNSDSCFTSLSVSSSTTATVTPPTSKDRLLYPIKEQPVESNPEERFGNASGFSELINAEASDPAVSCLTTASSSTSGPLTHKKQHTGNSSTKSKPSQTPNKKEFADIDSIIERLVEAGLSKRTPKKFPVSPDEIRFVCAKARSIFMNQPMLLELAAPVKIVGDIHGQFHDLLRIFKLCGFPPNANYLFLGDYVDRGKQSLETILLLLCLKIKFPENFFLLRGNHESAGITRMYGFYDECKRRSSLKSWRMLVDVFNTLPVAATIAGRIFCVHGGLSPQLTDLNQIKKIQRPTDIPEEGLLADLLWSDPQVSGATEEYLTSVSRSSSSSSSSPFAALFSSSSSSPSATPASSSSSPTHQSTFLNGHHGGDWTENDRGVSYCFNRKVVNRFCEHFDLDLVARGHMVVEQGYEFYAKRKLVTVFSAPNYCGEFDNWGAVMNVNKKLMCSFELLKPSRVKRG